MQPTENLTKDHEVIKEMLAVMTRIADYAKQTMSFDSADIEVVINFLENFCDNYHHKKEEEKLFPMIEKAGIPKQGPISVMIEDHEIGRNTLMKIAKANIAFRNGDRAAVESLVADLSFYVELLSSHLYKEDVILFPMSERILLEQQKNELEEYFRSVGDNFFGGDGMKKYLDVVSALKQKYSVS